jgi:hypothetical protein
VLYNVSDDCLVYYITDSAHHLDLREPNAADPDSVTQARILETNAITGWIAEYDAIVSASKDKK